MQVDSEVSQYILNNILNIESKIISKEAFVQLDENHFELLLSPLSTLTMTTTTSIFANTSLEEDDEGESGIHPYFV